MKGEEAQYILRQKYSYKQIKNKDELKKKRITEEEQEITEYIKKYFEVKFLYLKPEQINGDRQCFNVEWEHWSLHEFDDPEKYYTSFPAIDVEEYNYDKKTMRWTINDGFHRLNFCLLYNLPIPIMIRKAKENTHIHEKRRGCYIRYRVFDYECNEDLKNEPTAKCLKK